MLRKLKGLKFPEEFLTRFFFKEKLFKHKGHVLELGCGNGNNLALFNQFGWKTTGVDINKKNIENAKFNFRLLKKNTKTSDYLFIQKDMLEYLKNCKLKNIRCLLFPSSLYYLQENKIIQIFEILSKRQIIKKNCSIYFRMRMQDDYRFKKSKKLKGRTKKILFEETGEKNCINTFYKKKEFINLLKKYLKLSDMKTMINKLENYQNDKKIFNSDFVVWGKLK